MIGLSAQIFAQIGLRCIDLQLEVGREVVAIVGPNGAGKTSLLRILLGLSALQRGRIVLDDRTICDRSKNINLPIEARKMGYVPQDYALFQHMTVYENLDFALSSGHPQLSRRERQGNIQEWLTNLQVLPFAMRRPQTLSGGERQRIALARALCVKPRALVLDEPLAALDVDTRATVRTFLATVLIGQQVPTLVVTHEAADARALAARIAVIEEGKLSQLGTWDELVRAPATPFVAAFLGK